MKKIPSFREFAENSGRLLPENDENYGGRICSLGDEYQREFFRINWKEILKRFIHFPAVINRSHRGRLVDIRDSSHNEFGDFDNLITEYMISGDFLKHAIEYGGLERRMLKGDVLDFNCRTGASTITLAEQGARVTATGNDESIFRIPRIGFPGLKIEDRLEGGFDYVGQTSKRFDLVCVFGFGNYSTGRWEVQRLRDATRSVLKKNGRVVINSNLLTMDLLREEFRAPLRGLNPYVIVSN